MSPGECQRGAGEQCLDVDNWTRHRRQLVTTLYTRVSYVEQPSTDNTSLDHKNALIADRILL